MSMNFYMRKFSIDYYLMEKNVPQNKSSGIPEEKCTYTLTSYSIPLPWLHCQVKVPGRENNITETMGYGCGADHLLCVSFQSLCKGICHCQIYEYACFG